MGHHDEAHQDMRLAQWGARLRGWGLEGLAAALLEAATPLSPLGAQLLYVAQPALGLFLPSERVGQLARSLEDPATVSHWRAQLFEPEDLPAVPDEEGPPDGPGN
jgi:hypothetical protein